MPAHGSPDAPDWATALSPLRLGRNADRAASERSITKMYSQRPLSYAPTPYSYTPNPALAASINLDEVCCVPFDYEMHVPLTMTLQEVRLASSSAERDLYESLAEIFSIIVTLDGLEKAYIKDVVTETEYTETCTRLLKQYKSSLGDETVAKEFNDLETFKRSWGVSCYSI